MKKQIEYVSAMTQFIRELHARNPHLAEEQRKARARWWDRAPDPALDPNRDPAERERLAASKLRQQGYVYQTRN
jgi:hypothetical protein